ncbi:MAG: BT0820 family HAD-type phosphatase [Aestuariibaculum sp.]
MKFDQLKIIAVDFDGTIVKDAYPDIGKPIAFAFETLNMLQEKGFRLILWTYRKGKRLDEAVKFCESKGIYFYAVNRSFPEEEFDGNMSRKIHADIFIDDRNIGGMLDWGKIYQMLTNQDLPKKDKRKGLFGFLK